MEWIALGIAGLFEIVWAVALKFTDGFTKWVPTTITLGGMFLSFWFLSIAMRSLPLGVSYAIWTGIGTIGVAIVGIIWLGESANLWKLFFIGLILVGIVGLKSCPL